MTPSDAILLSGLGLCAVVAIAAVGASMLADRRTERARDDIFDRLLSHSANDHLWRSWRPSWTRAEMLELRHRFWSGVPARDASVLRTANKQEPAQ